VKSKGVLNALTFDVEEHFQVHNLEGVVNRADWGRHPSRVVGNTRRILRLLRQSDVRATFFVLGWVADRQPSLVREIRDDGHEVATHGYWHELIYRQTPAQFAEDLARSLEAIQRASGLRPIGYRAPGFSITRDSLWAIDILRRHGMRFDSSIFPLVAHDRYGLRGASRFANRVSDGLWEFPVSTVRVAGQNLPVAGGGYFRLYPFWLTERAVAHLNAQGHAAVMYLHPWEFDPEQPPVKGVPLLAHFRHHVNLGKTEDRLRRLLGEFAFAPMGEVFADELASEERPLHPAA
jgi:polysaccharide deacetylase family protein (PEP-CTERM system associated)